MVKPLATKTAQELLDEPFPSMKWLVEGIIAPGTILLVGSPKAGKSWFAIELALSVSLGISFLDHETRRGPVLYLSLEDKFERIQRRLFTLVDEAVTVNIVCATFANLFRQACQCKCAMCANAFPPISAWLRFRYRSLLFSAGKSLSL